MGNIKALTLLAAGLITVAVFAGGYIFAAEQQAAAPANLNAIHDPMSRNYDSDCLKCHAAILQEGTSDPRVLSFHQAMLPYTPGYSSRKGPQSKNCTTCHQDAIDFTQESGSSLRRSVSVESCIYCHGRSGPGPTFYR